MPQASPLNFFVPYRLITWHAQASGHKVCQKDWAEKAGIGQHGPNALRVDTANLGLSETAGDPFSLVEVPVISTWYPLLGWILVTPSSWQMWVYNGLPSGNLTFIVDFPIFPLKIVIFHSYVSLPEGIMWKTMENLGPHQAIEHHGAQRLVDSQWPNTRRWKRTSSEHPGLPWVKRCQTVSNGSGSTGHRLWMNLDHFRSIIYNMI